jgi:hypothetical protein
VSIVALRHRITTERVWVIETSVRAIFAATLCAIGLVSETAHAYPSSVVFAPTGESRKLGEVGVFGYASYVLHKRVAPGVTWFGLQVGLAPTVPYGSSGLSFGGVEAGVDLFGNDLQGSPAAFVKPVTNVKVQPVTELRFVPNVALGILGIALPRRERSLALVYGSLTKTFDFGKITLGLAGFAGGSADDRYRESHPLFRSTWPFASGSRLAWLGGWSSPSFGRFSVALDHVAGVSEISSTNLALNYSPVTGATWAIGGWVVGDRAAYASGAFTYLSLDFNPFRSSGERRV